MSDTCVYVHTRADDGKVFYVGIGKADRPHEVKLGRNQWWRAVVAKHGRGVHVLTAGIDRSTASRMEVQLIAHYRRVGEPLTNLTNGGDGGWEVVPEVKARIATAVPCSGRPSHRSAWY